MFLAQPLLNGEHCSGALQQDGDKREATMLWTIAVILLVL